MYRSLGFGERALGASALQPQTARELHHLIFVETISPLLLKNPLRLHLWIYLISGHYLEPKISGLVLSRFAILNIYNSRLFTLPSLNSGGFPACLFAALLPLCP